MIQLQAKILIFKPLSSKLGTNLINSITNGHHHHSDHFWQT
jgi:hypothetical protein